MWMVIFKVSKSKPNCAVDNDEYDPTQNWKMSKVSLFLCVYFIVFKPSPVVQWEISLRVVKMLSFLLFFLIYIATNLVDCLWNKLLRDHLDEFSWLTLSENIRCLYIWVHKSKVAQMATWKKILSPRHRQIFYKVVNAMERLPSCMTNRIVQLSRSIPSNKDQMF